MSTFKRTIGKATGFATAFLGAVATEHLAHEGSREILGAFSAPVMLVLSHLLTHIGHEFIAPIGEEIIEQFNHKRPNELNHDIQRELVESMKNAIDGIEILYKDKYPEKSLTKKTKKFLRKFKKEFFEEFSPEQGYTIEENDLKKIIYNSDTKKENHYLFVNDGENTISKLLNEKLKEELIRENIDTNFQNFFLEKFLPLTQFYFGEKLKHDKNGAARRAMERMLSEETLIGINKLIELQEKSDEDLKNQKWLGKAGKLSKKKIDELKLLVSDLKQTNKLEVEFSYALDKRFDELISKYEYLHSDVRSLKTNVFAIRKILSINMRIAIVVVIICVAFVTFIFVQHSNSDFGISITLEKEKRLKISSEYPSLEYPAKLLLILPNGKTEITSVNENNAAYFPKLNSKWKNKEMLIKLDDMYWELANDSIFLSDNNIILGIRPNNTLRNISGNVFSKKDSKPIANAIVKLEDTTIYTNSQGVYSLLLPYYMLRKKHEIKFFADGFKEYSDIFLPNSSKGQVSLTPLK